MYTVQVKIKPYLKAYLVCRANYIDNNKTATITTLVGAIAKPLLARIPEGMIIKPMHGDDVFTFDLRNIEDFELRRGNFYMPEDNQKIFGNIIRNHFAEIIVNYCTDKIRYSKSYKMLIAQFCADYSMPFNNVNYETLYKIIQRHGVKKRNNNTNSCQVFVRHLSEKFL